MAKQDIWTKEQLINLYKYRNQDKKDIKQIASMLKKTVNSIASKYKRVDWDAFNQDPDAYLSGEGANKKWSQVEMAQLYAFLQADKSYNYIAEELDRTYVSVERKAQTTDWQAWKMAVGDDPTNVDEVTDTAELMQRYIDSLVQLSRQDPERLEHIEEEDFLRQIGLEGESLPIEYSDIKDGAKGVLNALGFGNPEIVNYGEGTYIIVGDSHGKHTKTPMFELLKQVEKFIKPNKIIHVGHIVDDDNDISWDWGEFDNLVVNAKIEELRLVQNQRNKFKFKYEVVRGYVRLGKDLVIMNQDMITDYTKTAISSLDSEIFDEKLVVNCHRLELVPKCSNDGMSYYASPGALCERHIAETIKQINFKEKIVKQAFSGGFSKYRKMQHMFKYWNQGMIIVHVDKNGEHTIVPCSIEKVDNQYITSYFDKIITPEGVKNPDKKIFVSADTHSPNHDADVLDIQEQICTDFKSDVYVNVGDVHDFRSLNHHIMERGGTCTENVLDESAKAHHVLKRMAKWAKECHLIVGNHERFAADFINKFPQFNKYLDFGFLCSLDSLGYILTSLKNVLKIGDVKFIHGDLVMFGQPGNKVEKTARTFGNHTFVGHIHYPSIRFGTYSVGLSGKLDQEYNEPTASTWIHGFGLCNIYKGKSWLTTVPIVDNKCIINKKTYTSKNPKNWELKDYNVSLVYK